jgi:catechol 2,3-dioxygenase
MGSIDPALSITSVDLAVSDVQRSVDFYTHVLGLPLIDSGTGFARLGPGGRPALTLTEIEDPEPAPSRSTGLFHVAWLHPSRAALADTTRRVLAAGWRIDGAADHSVSEALYLSDPDRLGIEIYSDRPRERWVRPASGEGVVMVTEPLDIDDLLAQFTGEPSLEIDPATVIGHVHMKVADVQRALSFYRDSLGFEEQMQFGSQAAFLSAGGYHHHIGLNSWESRGGAPAPDRAPGVRRVGFTLGGQAAVIELAGLAGPDSAGDGVLVRDPDSVLLAFSSS